MENKLNNPTPNNKNKNKQTTEEETLIHELEEYLIQELTKETKKQGELQEYTNKIDIHYTLKNHPKYKIDYLQKIDITYINIKTEDNTKKGKL